MGIHCSWLLQPSVQFSRSVVSDSLQPHELQHARPPCPSPTPRVYPNSCSSSQWCHPAISSFHPLLLLPPIPPSIRSFPMSRLFAWGGQNIGVSASAPVLPMNTQDRSPLGWTSWISLQSKGLSRVFSNTTVQTHQCFSAQLSSALYPTSFHIILHALVAPNLTDSLSLTNIHNFAHIASVSMFSLHFSSH